MTIKNSLGVILFPVALFLFAAGDTTVKYLSASFSVPLLVWARFAVHLLIMLVVVAPGTGREIIVTQKPWLMVFRALMLVFSSLFIQQAFQSLPLAETTAVFFVTPLLVALLAGPMLGEKLQIKTWLALFGGFCGVMLIVRPEGALVGVGVVYTLASALCNTFYQILTRKLSATEPVMRQLFYTALVGTISMSFALPAYWTGDVPTPQQALLIVSLGLFAGGGHFLLIRAFRETPASTLSPMFYLQLVWVTLLGWIVFDQLPDMISAAGMLVIGASGLSLAWRWRSDRH